MLHSIQKNPVYIARAANRAICLGRPAAAACNDIRRTQYTFPCVRIQAAGQDDAGSMDGARDVKKTISEAENHQQIASHNAVAAQDNTPQVSGQEQHQLPETAGASTSSATSSSSSSSTGPGNLSDSTPAEGGSQESTGAGAAAVGGGGGGASGGAPTTVTLISRFNGVGYTFVLAGFLKVVTVGGLAMGTPVDVARTAFGKVAPYLMVPVGLGLCWVAKTVVDTGLHETKHFMRYMIAALAVLYFGLVKLMYRYDPQTDWVRRPRPRMPGQMAELRAQLGDRELLAAGDMDSSRFYQAERPGGRELYDDVAWYEGRYPSQLASAGQQQQRSSSRRAALAVTDTEEEYTVAASTAQPRAAVRDAVRRSFLSENTR